MHKFLKIIEMEINMRACWRIVVTINEFSVLKSLSFSVSILNKGPIRQIWAHFYQNQREKQK